ncbi:hypothetical protein C8R44DRAFT_742078 [Mycena epipterygia]|nr:hypothetical protein C8R44DRAFT_742078 [Mycena epipterygia]
MQTRCISNPVYRLIWKDFHSRVHLGASSIVHYIYILRVQFVSDLRHKSVALRTWNRRFHTEINLDDRRRRRRFHLQQATKERKKTAMMEVTTPPTAVVKIRKPGRSNQGCGPSEIVDRTGRLGVPKVAVKALDSTTELRRQRSPKMPTSFNLRVLWNAGMDGELQDADRVTSGKSDVAHGGLRDKKLTPARIERTAFATQQMNWNATLYH